MEHLKSLFTGPRGQIAWPILIFLLLTQATALWVVYAATNNPWLQLVVFVLIALVQLGLAGRAVNKRPFNDSEETMRKIHEAGGLLFIPGAILTYLSIRYIDSEPNFLFWFFIWLYVPSVLFSNMRRPQTR